MLVRELINVLKNFPRKHIFTLLIGLILIISISLLGNIKFTEENQYSELTKSLSLSSLTDDYQIDIPPIEKEALIKRNDSLFTILKQLGVLQEDIIQLINSKESSLLSKIEVGDKIKILMNDKGELLKMLYIDDIKSGIQAERNEDSYYISKYESKIEKVKVFKHVIIEDSMYVSGLKENVPDSVLMDLAYINGWDIDFTHDIRKGDSYNIIYEEIIINGEKVLEDLDDIDSPVDIVDGFRPSKEALDIARDTINIKAKVLWLQLGIKNLEAKKLVEQKKIEYIENRCTKMEYQKHFLKVRQAFPVLQD